MDLGFGEFVTVSACCLLPYESKGIAQFLQHMTIKGASLRNSTYLDISPENVNFSLVWEGIPEISFNHFDYKYLDKCVLGDVDVRLDSVDARLQVQFVDQLSYQVNLHFNSDIVVYDETKYDWSDKIEKIAMDFFKALNPVYGCVGIERTVCGIQALEAKQCLPYADKIFLNERLSLDKPDVFHALVDNVQHVLSIEGVGFYLRKTDVWDFKIQESEVDQLLVATLFQSN